MKDEHTGSAVDTFTPTRSDNEFLVKTRSVGGGEIEHQITCDHQDDSTFCVTTDSQKAVTRRIAQRLERRSDLRFDPLTGAKLASKEMTSTANGTKTIKEIVYGNETQQTERLTIVGLDGAPISRSERVRTGTLLHCESHTSFAADGRPALTTIRRMDTAQNRLVSREQITWQGLNKPAFTEIEYYDQEGHLERFTKVLHESSGAPLWSETQYFCLQQKMIKKELIVYRNQGRQAFVETQDFNADGTCAKRVTEFFDEDGVPVSSAVLKKEPAENAPKPVHFPARAQSLDPAVAPERKAEAITALLDQLQAVVRSSDDKARTST